IPRFPFFRPVRVGPSWLKLFLDMWMTVWTVSLLVRGRYDVVHAHEEAVFWCVFLKPLFRFKLAYDMHSSLPQQLNNFRFTNSKLLVRIFDALEGMALAKSDAVIAICPDLEEFALRRGVQPERLFLIENSIFEDVRLTNGNEGTNETPAEPIRASNEPRIVYAGTFESYQGVDLLIRAFAKVHAQRDDATLWLVGGRPDQIAAMRELAESLGVASACHFTGSVSKARARQFAETASILVSPRVDGTNTPLKIYEQLASGKPLVATRIRSHTQVLTDDVCILVEPDPDDFAAGLLRALNDPEEGARIASNAQELYETAYSRARYEEKTRRFLEKLK
ncbi:MAG: glycosyltransferase family 4 protein, partial [Pseudomonadota bacterium]